MHIFLTSDGQKFAKDKIEPIIELENNVFEEMSPEESREFLRLTQKYVALYREKQIRLSRFILFILYHQSIYDHNHKIKESMSYVLFGKVEDTEKSRFR